MEQIADDPEGFEEEGGWNVLNTSTEEKKTELSLDANGSDAEGDWLASQVLLSLFPLRLNLPPASRYK